MPENLTQNEAVEEALAILDQSYNIASLYQKPDGSPRFLACKAKLSYSIDGGKTIIELGEVNIGDVHVAPDADDASP